MQLRALKREARAVPSKVAASSCKVTEVQYLAKLCFRDGTTALKAALVCRIMGNVPALTCTGYCCRILFQPLRLETPRRPTLRARGSSFQLKAAVTASVIVLVAAPRLYAWKKHMWAAGNRYGTVSFRDSLELKLNAFAQPSSLRMVASAVLFTSKRR